MGGRINIHLGDLKEKLVALHPGYGGQSTIIKALVEAYIQGRLMHISPKVQELLDAGKEDEAIELLTNDLVALRAIRVQAGQQAASKRGKSKAAKAQEKAGIKSPLRRKADAMVQDMLKMQQDQNVIEFSEGGENDEEAVEKPKGTRKVL